MLDIIKTYLDEQIAAYKAILASFPKLSMDDHFIGHGLYCSVRDTLHLLVELKVEANDAKSCEEFWAVYSDIRSEYDDKLKKALSVANGTGGDWASKISARVEARQLQVLVDALGSIRTNLDKLDLY